jgi:hypothetical protein
MRLIGTAHSWRHVMIVRSEHETGAPQHFGQSWDFGVGGIFSPSFTLYCDDNPLLSDMNHFEPDTKPRDPSLTIADTLGSSPELGTSTLRSKADPASAVTTSAQVIQPVVSLQLSPTQRYRLNHHRSIRLLMDFKSLPQCQLRRWMILGVRKTTVINHPPLLPQCHNMT